MKTIQLLLISKIIVVFFIIITINACESTGSKSTVTEDIVFEPMVIELEDMELLSIASAFEGEETIEWGMMIDKIEIVEYCSSAEVLERWTK